MSFPTEKSCAVRDGSTQNLAANPSSECVTQNQIRKKFCPGRLVIRLLHCRGVLSGSSMAELWAHSLTCQVQFDLKT